jgi:hypothetical protein
MNMMSEKSMEDSIIHNPEKYLGEQGLKLVARQYRIGDYIFDLMFEDRHGAKLIVELQKGTLDRTHTYKILDYYHAFKEKNPNEYIELMVIANTIPRERRKRLSDLGITFKEIPESEFIEQPEQLIEIKKIVEQKKGNPQDNQIIKLKSAGDAILNKEKFNEALGKCSNETKELFLSLLDSVKYLPVNKYATNKPDFRLQKKNIFCEFVPESRRNSIRINLRVDSNYIDSKIFNLEEINDPSRPGKRWQKFYIDDTKKLNEALRLINEVYEFND